MTPSLGQPWIICRTTATCNSRRSNASCWPLGTSTRGSTKPAWAPALPAPSPRMSAGLSTTWPGRGLVREGVVQLPPAIAAIWEDTLPASAEGEPAMPGPGAGAVGCQPGRTTSILGASSAASALPIAGQDSRQPSAQPTPMALEGSGARSCSPGRAAASNVAGPRRSLRHHTPPRPWYAAAPPPPPPPPQRMAPPSRPGDSGTCRGRQRQ